jgi:DNA-binding response OmpR family regulator
VNKAAPAQPEATARPAPYGQPRVLLAEDEPLVSMDLAARIAKFGFDVSAEVDSVEAALQALESGLPDIALLDANLHGESSVAVAVELHKRGVPIVFITGYDKIEGLPDDLASAPKLSKPILDEDLRRAMTGLLSAAAD